MTSEIYSAFTLIELLIVIAILGILAAFALFGTQGVFESSRDNQRKSDLKQYQTALEGYANKVGDFYPSTLENNTWTTYNTLCTEIGLTLSVCPKDPADGKTICQGGATCGYLYISNGPGGATDTATEYLLYGPLEKPASSQTAKVWWIICSNGKSGEVLTDPDLANMSDCPLP